ncbi:craniofacial development protein 2-like [Macrobrachium rosenbergii]|uniref:craniofacial development protein 2-like n=1 Tax=Macrobrachium rosenbergii TaxID=79674 RepID=UPI0034D64924
MGDFNAKIGQVKEDCVGKFGYGERNERGDDLINFAVAHDFKIMNTFFEKSENKKWTWQSPNHETRNEIDYILHNIVKNVDVLNQVNVGSDHRMIIEKTNEYKIPLIVALIDYTKEFDSVETEEVMSALEEQGVRSVYINVLRHICDHATSFTRLHKDSEPFQHKRGVRQGDTSSPKLFAPAWRELSDNLTGNKKE